MCSASNCLYDIFTDRFVHYCQVNTKHKYKKNNRKFCIYDLRTGSIKLNVRSRYLKHSSKFKRSPKTDLIAVWETRTTDSTREINPVSSCCWRDSLTSWRSLPPFNFNNIPINYQRLRFTTTKWQKVIYIKTTLLYFNVKDMCCNLLCVLC